ncbi:hypothetical protein L1987_43311 [Smallanthus sonchifolius]|uniref:Uncharacterized protein n=1 Tax=Smallanthus sonchifolius TaxID=185202 RepID=A0ACB9GMA2_9ASTR|nr:hypothetical protein L1987_43311 [Smallanthus sonchifolius]
MGIWRTVIKRICTCGKVNNFSKKVYIPGDHHKGLGTMSSDDVRLSIKDHHVVIDNGILQVTLSKPGGLVTGVQYNGLDNVLGILNHEDESGRKGVFEVFKVIVETEEQIEVSFSRPWDPSLNGKLAPINIDKRFVLLRGSSGFYTYAIYEQLGSEEWQASALAKHELHSNSEKTMADDRRRYMPLPDDRLAGRAQPLAFQEAVSLINPVVPEFKGEVEDKYHYTCENRDLMVHGWISHDPPVGFWKITPSNEFCNGGPLKQNLCSHVGPTCLAVFVGAHYAGDDQMMVEVNSWPYSFPASEDFPKSHERGKVRGRLLVRDRYIHNDDKPGNGAYVGLAPPGDVGSWQRE